MKFIIISILLAFVFPPGQAQLKGFSVGPFVEAGWPTANFKETNKNGFGAGLGADIRLGKIGLTGSVGYMHFAGKTIDKGDGLIPMPAINALPIRAGLKYRLAPVLYAKLETGLVQFIKGNGSAFILSPGIGIRILGLELQAKYEIWKNEEIYSFWGLKAGINF